MEYKEDIDICINLINLIGNATISNDEILNFISTNNYLEKARRIDKQDNKQSLTPIIENIINVLTNVNKSLPIHNHRYLCSYLDIKDRLFYGCEKHKLSIQELVQYLSVVEYIILQSHFTEYIIRKLLSIDNTKLSEELILKISDKSYHYSSYRLIANYYGKKGDKENFLKTLKKCDARKDVWDLQWIKSNFIEAYSEKHTLEKLFKLVEQKEFGKEYLVPALNPYIKTKQFDEIKSILRNPCFDNNDLYLKEIILCNAFEKTI